MEITPPNGKTHTITDGIYAKEEVVEGIKRATQIIEEACPDKIITIGGNCIVSQAPFDYLHGNYPNMGIIWIDAHPDVSSTENDYPNAHAMVLRTLMGQGEESLSKHMKHSAFTSDEILYIGLQEIHHYQEAFLNEMKVDYKIQTDECISNSEISSFMKRFDHIVIHLDIDVLDATMFHSTYFANKDLVGDGSGSGKMTMDKLSSILTCICEESDVVGLTIAEYLPFDEHKLHNMFKKMNVFND